MTKDRRVSIITSAVLILLLAVGTSITALAVEPTTEETYSYLTGKRVSQSRNAAYAEAALIEDEAEQEAFLAEQGIGEEPYSEEAAASYSYIAGRQRGASYSIVGDDTELPDDITSSYSYVTGRQRGASYRQE